MIGLVSMMARSPRVKTPRPCGDEHTLAGRGPSQMGWYRLIAGHVHGQTVIDVGCGSGEGLQVLAEVAREAVGIDLDPRLKRPDLRVEIKSIDQVPSKSFDIVVCLDVIEHVESDGELVSQLFRVARSGVFVTTPNYSMSFNQHPYHVREYTPYEFRRLFHGRGPIRTYVGTAKGREIVELRRVRSYLLVNALYAWRPTVLAAKILKRLLRVKMWAHQAVLVTLPAPVDAASGAPAAT